MCKISSALENDCEKAKAIIRPVGLLAALSPTIQPIFLVDFVDLFDTTMNAGGEKGKRKVLSTQTFFLIELRASQNQQHKLIEERIFKGINPEIEP